MALVFWKAFMSGIIIASLGIHGCGKTFYGLELKNKIKNLEIVCPDDIKRNFNDLNEQSFSKLLSEELEKIIKANKPIYYSATNLTIKNRSYILNLCKKYNKKIIFVIFLTSFRPDICEERIKKDLLKGIEHINPTIKDTNGLTIIKKQAEKFRQQMRDISSLREELKQNSADFRIKFIECSKS